MPGATTGADRLDGGFKSRYSPQVHDSAVDRINLVDLVRRVVVFRRRSGPCGRPTYSESMTLRRLPSSRRGPGATKLAGTVLLGALVLSSCATDPDEAATASAEVATDGDSSAPEPAADTVQPATSPDAAAGDTEVAVPDLLDFSSVTVAGDAFDGASVAGRPTVFWFWAPWCATCRAQISGVGDLAGQFGEDVAVIGVGALDDSAAIEEFAGTVSSDVTLLSDPDGAVWRHFGVTAQSTYLVLDAAGEPQASGFLDGDDLVSTVSALVTG